MQGKRDDAYIEAASNVVDGLRGDAFVTAQELGLTALWKGPTQEQIPTLEGEDTVTVTVSGIDHFRYHRCCCTGILYGGSQSADSYTKPPIIEDMELNLRISHNQQRI